MATFNKFPRGGAVRCSDHEIREAARYRRKDAIKSKIYGSSRVRSYATGGRGATEPTINAESVTPRDNR